MNYIITFFCSLILYIITLNIFRKNVNSKIKISSIIVFVINIPAFLIIIYYLHFIEPPIWYIEFRKIDKIEMLVSTLGIGFGFIGCINKLKLISIKNTIFVILLILMTMIPFSKGIIFPVGDIHYKWIDNICIQTTPATCGPCSIATILRYYNIFATEREIAKECFTSGSGTENWYMIRYLEKKSLNIKFGYVKSIREVPIPSIIGVKLATSGHYITVLGKQNRKYIIGDSLQGKLYLSEEEFNKRYLFKNFYINILEK